MRACFWTGVWRSHYSAQSARAHLHDLTRLGLTVLPAKPMAVDALEIALRHKMSAYDACYIAAAARAGFPLTTADARLARQAAAGDYDVRWREAVFNITFTSHAPCSVVRIFHHGSR